MQHAPNEARLARSAPPKRWRRVRGGALLLVAAVLLVFSSMVIAAGVRHLKITGFENSPGDQTTIRSQGRDRVAIGALVGLAAVAVLVVAVRDLRDAKSN